MHLQGVKQKARVIPPFSSNWKIIVLCETNVSGYIDLTSLSPSHISKNNSKFLDNPLKGCYLKQTIQISPNGTIVRLWQHFKTP